MSRWLTPEERKEGLLFLCKVMNRPAEPDAFWEYKRYGEGGQWSDRTVMRTLNMASRHTSSRGIWTVPKVSKIRIDNGMHLRPPVDPEIIRTRNATRKALGTLGKNGYDASRTPPPQVELPLVPPTPPVPDAVGCFWERLDKLALDIAELNKDLAEHRSNLAHAMEDQNEAIREVVEIARGLLKEWRGA